MVARNLPQAGVFVGKNRFSSCVRARESGFNVAVLDDGFQHRRLARDLDIVLYSPDEKIALREPRSSLKRADICLLKNKDYCVVSRGFFSPWDNEKIPAETMAQKKALAFCGIARPQRFLAQLREEGLNVVAAMTFPDHHSYPPSSLRKIVRAFRKSGAEIVLTTEKDSIKIEARRSSFGDIPVFYLKIGLRLEPEADERMRQLLEKAARS
jgi:tetraacyldisaccharide 4'-kinase